MEQHKPIHAFLFILLLGVGGMQMQAQSPMLDWQECQEAARENYPELKKSALFREQLQRSQEIIRKAWLPQLAFQAQATYQTDVTSVPLNFPGVDIPRPNNDQYKATLTVSQLILDGGNLKAAQEAEASQTLADEAASEASLYQIRQEVNQVYFGVLLLQSQVKILYTAKENLEAREKELASAVKHGVALPSAAKTLKVEQLKLDQKISELEFSRKALLGVLGNWMGRSLDPNTQLRDYDPAAQDFPGRRPEQKVFQARIAQLQTRSEGLKKALNPTLGAFVTGGYGNPGLNFLDNTFQPYAIGGVRLDWKIWDWGKTKKQQELIALQQRLVQTEKEMFDFRMEMALTQVDGERDKISALIDLDRQILPLRREILQTAESQMKNGTLTATQYVLELNALRDAELAERVHSLQYSQTLAQRHFILGSYENE